ncbi:MAG: DUF5011 domain-containing protein [Opitutae bacterium]|nr:DUF5011 domain-containing protein [Opitutae bacterium]
MIKFISFVFPVFLTFFLVSATAYVRNDDLVIWYTFDELQATTVPDQSGNGLDGTTSGDLSLEDSQFGKALKFNGTSDKITLNYDEKLNLPQYSVSIWMNSVKSNDGFVGVFGRSGRHTAFYQGTANQDKWYIHHRYKDGGNGNAGVPNTGSDFTHGEWHHVVLTNNGTVSATYVDGKLEKSGVMNYPYGNTKSNLNIGANPDGANNQWYEGLMDDVRLYSVSLNSQEVSRLFNGGKGDFSHEPVVSLNGESFMRIAKAGTYVESGATATDQEDGDLTATISTTYHPPAVSDARSPVARWSFNGDATDVSGNGNDATLVGDAAFADAKFGQGLQMDNDADYAEVASFKGVKDSSMVSISAWVNIKSFGAGAVGDGGILTSSTTTNPFLLWVNYDAQGDGNPSISLNVGDTGAANRVDGPVDVLTEGEWHHVVGVMDGASRKIYIDGEMKAELPSGIAQAALLDGPGLRIGSWSNTSNFDFDGSIDEVRVYDIALTQEEVTALHTWDGQDASAPTTVDTDVVGDWNISYSVTDSFGITTTAERKVRVFDPTAPVITLVGEASVQHELATEYNDTGASVTDVDGTALDASLIKVTGVVDGGAPGTYSLAFDFTDEQGRAAETVFRTVNVSDTTPPVVTLVGGESIRHQIGQPFIDPGFSAEDTADGAISAVSDQFEWNALVHRGFHGNWDETVVDFNGNGGLLKDIPLGENKLQSELYFNGDASFQAAGVGITQNDNFRNLFFGVFNAKIEGDYRFGMEWPDDRGSFWLDLDRDGVFELEGGRGSEWMNLGPRYGYTTVKLQRGVYKIAFGHMEGGGHSRIQPRVQTPKGAGPDFLSNVNPGSSIQRELWGIDRSFDVNAPGTYQVTYTATDAAGNSGTATRTIIVEEIQDRPVLALKGRPILKHSLGTEYVDEGATVVSADGTELDASKIIVTGAVDHQTMGEYDLTYNYTDVLGRPADAIKRQIIVGDLEAPTIAIEGEGPLEHIVGQVLIDPGVTVTDNIDQDLIWGSTIGLPETGLVLHLDASSIAGVKDGDTLNYWSDLSVNGNDLTDVRGDPSYAVSAINQRPAVHLDGDDFMASTIDIQRKYSIFTVSRLDGSMNGRLISSLNINWFIGYWGNNENVFHPEGWASAISSKATTKPHLYTGISTGASNVQFYADGVDKTTLSTPNGRIGKLQLGGWKENNERSAGYVSEVLIYDVDVTAAQRLSVEAYLASKYRMLDHPEYERPNLNVPGEYTILYTAVDSAGNRSFATRKLVVKPDPTIPVIVLDGDALTNHQAGTDFTDPGSSIVDGEGNPIDGASATVTGSVDSSTLGTYTLTYEYTGADDKVAMQVVRTVVVADTTGPVITLEGDSVIQIAVGADFSDPGAKAVDAYEGEVAFIKQHEIPLLGWVPGLLGGGLGGNINTTSPNPGNLGVDPFGPSHSESKSKPPWADNYTIVYSGQVFDEDGKVSFMGDMDDNFWLKINDQIVVQGGGWGNSRSVQLDLGGGDLGWHDFELRISNGGGGAGRARSQGFGIDKSGQAPDKQDVDNTLFEIASNTDQNTMDLFRVQGADYTQFDTSRAGSFVITYTAADSLGQVGTAQRTLVIREDLAKPLITLNGAYELTLEADATATYEDPGATATAGDGTVLKDDIQGEGTVNPAKPGVYTLIYDYVDANGNYTDPAIRKVTVVDSQPPVITLEGGDFIITVLGKPFEDPGFKSVDSVDGDVDTHVDSASVPGLLNHWVYTETPFSEDYASLESEFSIIHLEPAGRDYLGNGPNGQGLDFRDDTDFRTHPSLNQNDNYQNLFTGYFNAERDGEYIFDVSMTDDRSALWIDRDSDGVFSRSGQIGDERITLRNQQNKLFMQKGKYRIVIVHAEWGGGSSIKVMVGVPGGELENLHPSVQPHLWSTLPGGGVDTSTEGEYKLHYFASDNTGNLASASRTVVVRDDPDRPVIVLLGEPEVQLEVGTEYKDAGALLEDYKGQPLEDSIVTSEMPDGQTPGEYTITYNFTDAGDHVAMEVTRRVIVSDLTPPVITISGANPANAVLGQDYRDAGATANDARDGNVRVYSIGDFPGDGLVLHLDAGSFKGQLNDGDTITSDWEDLSGQGNSGDNRKGDPTWIESGLNGRPVVNFDGDDLIWTSKDFEAELANYSILTVARYTGGDNERVISTRGRNWLFGFHANSIRRFHSEGWLHVTGGSDTAWHLHVGDANNRDQGNFWLDGTQLTRNGSGLHDSQYKPRNISLGGFNDNQELSKCEVAEVLLYNRVITPVERTLLIVHLNSKYGINGGGEFIMENIDTSSEGERAVGYMAMDSSGNIATATRKVVMVDQPTLPVISLIGDAEISHDSGTAYTDAGATVADSDGNPLDASKLVVSNNVNVDIPGAYAVAYDFTTADGTSAPTVVRAVTVVDKTAPVITLVGGETYEHQLGNTWVDPGVSALDNADGIVAVTNSMLQENFFIRRGYMIDPSVDSLLDLTNDGGLLAQVPVGEVRYTSGPRGQGLRLDGDNDFKDHDPILPFDVGINQNDKYQNLFLAYFHCKIDGGRYEFGVEWPDDRASVWLDLDQDGIFELDGERGTELINGSTYQRGYKEFTLEKGFYKYAVAHREGGGGSRVDARFRAVIGPGPSSANVRPNPADPTQDGLWVQYHPIDVFTAGEYEITYSAIDAAGNASDIIRKVIVKTNPDAPIILVKGNEKMTLNYGDTFEDPGVTVEDLDGNELDASRLVVTGEVKPERMGLYKLEYNYRTEAGVPARTAIREVTVVDAEPPAITLAGDASVTVLQGQSFEDPGAIAVDNYDGALQVSSSEVFPTNGLLMHLDAGSITGVVPGDEVTSWTDLSTAGNHALKGAGLPYLEADAINGRPAVYFNGSSIITAPMTVGASYSIVAVAKADNIRNGRLMTSANELNENWILGYHGGYEDVFHPGTWRTNRETRVTGKPHLYSATSSGMNQLHFYADGVGLTTITTGNNNMGRFQMGGWHSNLEMSTGHVAEVLIYNRVLTAMERMALETRMNARDALNGVTAANVPVDTSAIGTYHVVYTVIDSTGNLGIARRIIEVVPDPNAPAITLLGGATFQHEAGEVFIDPGATLTAGAETLDASLVKVEGAVVANVPGDYLLTYFYKPYKKAPAPDVVRIVTVQDTKPPVITLAGEGTIRLEVGTAYTDPGFSATDLMDGDVSAISHLESTPNALDVNGYMLAGRDNNQLNFDQGNGLLSQDPVGVTRFSGDITGLNGDGAFRGLIPEITQNDDFQVVFYGQFYAKVDGSYEFGIDNADDRCAFWIDLDKDDAFESNGDNGNEVVFTDFNGGGWKTYSLTKGLYRVAIGFMEFNGGAWVRPRVTLPGGGRIPIHPANKNQAGHWLASPSSVLDVNTAGTYPVEYSAFDSSGNSSLATRTVVVVEDTSVPFIALNGDAVINHEVGTAFSDPGAKVTSGAGDVLEADLKGEGVVDTDNLGEYTLTYSYNGAVDSTRKVVLIDSTAPAITLVAHANTGLEVVTLTVGQEWVDPGVTLQDVGDAQPKFTTDRSYIANQLEFRGFTFNPGLDSHLDFSNNGGLMVETPAGQGFFKDGPAGEGFFFRNDTDFAQARIGIKHWDNFQSYATGYFLARMDGDYEFRTQNADDRATLWVDLDQDGIFKRNGGTQGDERLSWGNNGRVVSLVSGFYKVAIGHREGGGLSSIRAVFRVPAGAGPTELTNIHPVSPSQGGLWYSEGHGPVDMTRPGEHTITYYASDGSGNLSTATRKVIVEIDLSAPILTLVGDAEVIHEAGANFVDPGATVADAAGTELDKSSIKVTATLDGANVDGGVDVKVLGTYELLYEFTDASGKTAVPARRMVVVRDSIAPVITLLGMNPARITPGGLYEDAGATALDALDGDVSITLVSSKPTFKFIPGLLAGKLAGNNTASSSSGPNNGSLGIDPLGPTISEIKTTPPWAANTTIIYTGQIYDKDGKMAFTEHIDDGTKLTVAGQVLIDDGDWDSRIDANYDSPTGEGGWFDFEVRFRNGGGGAGVAVAPGFGFDPEGAKNWVLPRNSDPETADLFRYKSPQHNTIDTSREGEYTITFSVVDVAGNIAEVVRTIIVKDDLTLPVITLTGDAEVIHEAGTVFPDPGVTVADRKGTALDASRVVVSGSVDQAKLGTYTLAYDFTNDKGRPAPTIQRKVTVVDTTPPTIELVGGTPLKLNIGDLFQDPGVNVTDNLDQNLATVVQLEGSLEGLVAHWKFDDGSGDTAEEIAGGLAGVLTNFANADAAWVEGKFGKALQFNGINEYVLVPATDKLTLQAMTISAWVQAANFAQDGFIYEKTVGGQINSHYSLYLQGNDQLNFRLISGGNLNDTIIPAAVNLNVDEWNHIAVTYDGTVKSIYINGDLVTAMPSVIILPEPGNGISTIGALGSGSDYFFNGKIDDLRIYDRAVAEGDIHKLSKSAGIDTSQATVQPYVLNYSSTDSSGNSVTVKREIIVSNDAVAPVITMIGDAVVTVNVGDVYEDSGATALDNLDGNLTPFIDDGGTVDAVDTSKAGEYTITYDVADFSGNAAVQVTRKVIVASNDPVNVWINSTGLAALSTEEKALDADPDKDGIANLLEYALGGDPVKSDGLSILPSFDDSSGKLAITYYRIKSTADSTLVYRAELTTNLGDVAGWDESAVTLKGALQGVPQTDLPDGKAFAASKYERVQAVANTDIASEGSGKQFLRLVVEKN